MLKITAISPSSALKNAREVGDVSIVKYGSVEQIPPALIMYTDGGPEHRTTFLSVKITMKITMVIVECNECSKPRLVYAARKISASGKKNFHIVMGKGVLCLHLAHF